MSNIELKNAEGKAAGTVELDSSVFGIEPNIPVIHQVVTVQLGNLRQGTHDTNGRSEVSGGGAKPWRQFRSITFPLIGAFFTINVVLSLKGFLQVFDPIIALTNGGPGTATESVTMLIFRGGFSGGEFAYQTANAVVFFVVITVVSLVQFRVLQRREADF